MPTLPPHHPREAQILTPGAMEFLEQLHARFAGRRDELLQRRIERQRTAATDGRLDYLPETVDIRAADWQVAPIPNDLRDRRVEITGPTEPKMAINALNSGAKIWLADLEDANTPHWFNVVGGQAVLHDATRRALTFTSSEGREYRLRTDVDLPTVVMRPRGWHLDEEHLVLAGRPAVGALVDFGLHFFHNAAELVGRGSGPYYYLPKLESHLEARLWNEVFVYAQDVLQIPRGTVRATVLIETIPAAFEMEEILYELREHASGLNAGRWDYLFSIIKYFRSSGPDFLLPDRNAVTMTAPMMRTYTTQLVRTCHRRGAYAIGGMAAFIPSRRDPEVNRTALAKVRGDKTREAGDGFDGSWVAHPDLVPLCAEVFGSTLGTASDQRHIIPDGDDATPAQLLDVAATPGTRTRAGLRSNVAVCLHYIAVWLSGNGAVAINQMMEDAATAEISRAQIWQQVHAGAVLEDGQVVTAKLVCQDLDEAVTALGVAGLDATLLGQACTLVKEGALASEFPDFLTLIGYRALRADELAGAGARS